MNVATLALLLLPLAPLAAQDTPARPAKAAEGFEHVLPADAFGFVGVADVDALCAGMRASAMGQWWLDPANAAIRTALAQQAEAFGSQIKGELGVNPLDVLGLVHGRVALELSGSIRPDLDLEVPEGLCISLLADTGSDRDAVEKIVTALTGKLSGQKDVVQKSTTVGSTDVSVFESTQNERVDSRLQVAFHGDTLVVTVSFPPVAHDPMERVLAGLDGEPGDALAAAPKFRDSLAARSGGVQVWVDGGAIAATVKTVMDAEIANDLNEEDHDAGHEAELGLLKNLGLFDVGVLSASMTWSAAGTRTDARLDWAGEGWIPSFLRLLLGPGAESLFSAVPAGCLSASAGKAEFAAIFDEAMKALVKSGAIQPSDATDFLAQSEQELGFNLRDDLLDALDGRVAFVTCKVPPEERFPMSAGDPQNVVLMLGLKDGAHVNTLVEGVLKKTGLAAARQRTEFQGFELFNVPIMPGVGVNYALLPDLAVLSSSSTLVQDVLRRKAGGADLPVLSADADYKARRAQISGQPGIVDYSNSAESMKSMLGLLDVAKAELKSEAEHARPDNPVGLFASFLVALPPFDKAVIDAHFKGATVVAAGADAGGFTMQSTSP
jgi:hypothetical protein